MDNFMDKIAKKLGAQDVIRANAAAEAEELERLQARVAEYDACIQEIRKMNLRNTENETKLKELIDKLEAQNVEAVTKIADAYAAKLQEIEAPDRNMTELAQTIDEMNQLMSENMKKMDELFTQANEFSHKENVKVYRNVQAVLVEELQNQTKELMESRKAGEKKNQLIFALLIASLVAALASGVLTIVNILGIL